MSEDNDDDWFVEHIFSSPFFLSKPKHIAAAVSGGSDSMALLSYTLLWAEGRDIQVSAVTVDHGLRDGSAAEAETVAAYCAKRGIAHKTLRWDGWDGTGNLQASARDARYALMAEYAKQTGIDTIALGHTEDDQAETFVMRLARKSGVDGLASMKGRFRKSGVDWVRPLLLRSRAKLRAHLERNNISWVDDPSNEDARFERVHARKVIAELGALNIDNGVLSAVSHNMASAKDALKHYTLAEARTHAVTESGDLLLPRFEPLPHEISRQLSVNALQWIGRNPYGPRNRAIDDMDYHLSTSGVHTLAGCHITQTERHTRYTREFNAVRDLVGPTKAVWDGRWRLGGPHAPGLEIRALGEGGLAQCPDWRGTGLPRISLLASPAVWRGEALVAAPHAGLENGWVVKLWQPFVQFLLDGL
ncbi:tRNA lysidine(34) synthetase TilS [uncultured Litoreibacter sp.]|uniref:tRNA lysidine(34) synthetase TilS n=1 Tax=uncultured Litoreibacter sp. TaxID=1392394 RepID=UPI00262F7FA9|nr:tRNA lysidine(34) synthetase TilS [uncultured Litoreibacter sp.]